MAAAGADRVDPARGGRRVNLDDATRRRLFGFRHAFDHPVVLALVVAIVIALVAAPLIVIALRRAGKLDDRTYAELMHRCRSWAVIAPVMIVPILLGAAWFIAFVCVLSLLCYREFARATGLFRERAISLVVVLGIVALTFATFDHWYGFFVAIPPLTISLLAAVAIVQDRPQGYIQRVALGVLALLFIGVGLGHLGYMANGTRFREMIAMLLAGVELNDVFAYLSGRTLGRRKLAPNTSPNKTIAGALGALVLTTALVATVGHFVFRGSAVDRWYHLVGLGLIVSVAGQFGDLMLSSIKRDLGMKDMSHLIPGHGGLLDRFDSLLLVAPAVFHYVGYIEGIGLDQTPRIITG
jgi:phosphatidate cytidylyltransferase